MKKIYLKPEIEEVTVCSMHILQASKKINFKQKPDSEEDDVVDDFDLLL